MQKENNFDLVDDLVHFINNNSEFYKGIYLPVVHKFATAYKSHMSPKVSLFAPVVRQAYEYYKDFVKNTNPEVNLPEQLEQDKFIKSCNELYRQQKDHLENKGSDIQPDQDSVSEEIKHLVKLAGIGNSSNIYTPVTLEDITKTSSEKSVYMKENNIQPGTNEWFSLWFKNNGLNMPVSFRGRKND